MKPVLLIDVVGLTSADLTEDTPNLRALAARGCGAPMSTVLPAVTCSAQATMLTGTLPREHGVVGNGWFFGSLGETFLWRQSNRLMKGEKLYERARAADPSFRAAKLFWWFNQGAAVERSITPKPFYGADGSKAFSVASTPPGCHEEIEAAHGAFPFFSFWGPKSGLPSSRWIADATLHTLARHTPTLTLAYLPHLDYDHQRFGPDAPRSREAVRKVDALVGELIAGADAVGAETVVVSEYGIRPVSRPVHVNRILREAGLLAVRDGPFGETIDVFASRAFAVADHQVAHVHVADDAARAAAREALEATAGVEQLLDEDGKRAHGLDHGRAGDLVAVADADAWFTYYFWLDEARAPDFARTVDIHRKPGYDPCELFVDPALRLPTLRVARRLAQKALGFRYLMDVVPLDATLVRGSHGRLPERPEHGPVFLASRGFDACGGDPDDGVVAMTSVSDRVLALLSR